MRGPVIQDQTQIMRKGQDKAIELSQSPRMSFAYARCARRLEGIGDHIA